LRPAGDEDEITGGGRCRGEAAALIVDQQAAVEAFADLDPAAGIGAAVRAVGNLGPPGAEADRVVAGHGAGIAAAEPLGEITGRPAPGGHGLGRGLGEAAVVVGEIGGQVGLGRGQGLDPVEAQLGDEAILQGRPEPFDAALRLGYRLQPNTT
jgi:hypothetical protein